MEPLGTGDPIRLGPYRVVGVLGEGGMGKVYLGQDPAGRPAAVKVLLPELAHDQHLAQRFLREAHTARAVSSSGVARVLDARSEGDRPWIATEFLSGPTLDHAVRRYGPFDAAGVRALAASLAATLRDVHAAGLVHRDLKPANIVLTADGPRVIDFGIARPEHGLTLTTTGQVPVTPGYGAPEQVLGQRVGPAADVFSLGAVLAYAATGRPAFEGTHVAAVQYEVVHGEPRLASVPAELGYLIAPCLAKEPARRPAPGEIAAAFAPPPGADRAWRTGPLAEDITRRAAEAARQTARTEPGPGPGAGPSRRRVLRTALAAGGVVAAAGGAGGAWWLLREEPGAEPLKVGLARGATPLPASAATSGKAPKPLWGPLKVAAQPVDGVVMTPLSLRDVVVFAAKEGGLAARLTYSGKEKWRLPDAAAAAGVLALPELGFVAADRYGALLAYEASTAKLEWSVPDAEVGRFLTVDEDTVYVVTQGGRLRAVDLVQQRIRWTVPLPAPAVRGAGPKAATLQGLLVVSGADGSLLTFTTTTGLAVWEVEGQSRSAIAPVMFKDTVLLGGRTLSARRIVGGDEVWRAEASEPVGQGAGGWGPPLLRNDTVLAVNGTSLTKLTTTGSPTPLGKAARGPLPHTPLVVEGGAVWAVEADGRGVGAYSLENGTRLWTWAPGAKGPWALSGAGNRVYLVNAGTLTAMPTTP
ncbi:protein kinase domain-containing protein [Streptomyces goshikiensis]|uniref:serine/threonine-protein kinase n=1 Tax=Streptomyces goshikiensis TaxID=1942 RepID=UPI0036DCF168